jgi:tetratricopeptide (TPR) repeat protein
MANNNKEFGKLAQRLSRNPLGIIALFIVMIYTMATLLVGLSKLDPGLQKIFVWFLVTFPVLVLIAFYILVTKHSGKLYAPQDFSDEANFLRILEAAEFEKSPRFISFIRELSNNAEKELDDLRAELKKTSVPSLTEEPSEEVKEKLDDFSQRLELFEALRIPLEPEDYVSRGRDYYHKGKEYLAMQEYDKALKLKPDKRTASKAWNNKAVIFNSLGLYDKAIKACDKAIGFRPDNGFPWYNKACSYSLKNDKSNALKCLSKAISLDPESKIFAKEDKEFRNLWDDPDFKKIIS